MRLPRVFAPQTEPPFDDEVDGHDRSVGIHLHLRDAQVLPFPRPSLTEGALALELPLPVQVSRRTPLRLVPSVDRETGRAVTPLLEDPRRRAVQLMRAVLEVLVGDRPSRHLATSATEHVLRHLELTRQNRGPRPWARSLRSLRVTRPSPGVAEVCAVVQRGGRGSAIAMRMEGLDGRWMITALQILG